MSRSVVALTLCVFATLGCANRILQGEWICVDSAAAPEGMARLIFTDASHVDTTDGKTNTYSILDGNRLVVTRASGVKEVFTFERQGENLLLVRSGKRIAYARQL